MILPDKKTDTYTRYVSEFKGLNRLPVGSEGELLETKNMVFDKYPVMSVRGGRTLFTTAEAAPQGLLFVGSDCYLVTNNRFYKNGVNISPEQSPAIFTAGLKSMVEFWGKIYIFPDKLVYDIETGKVGNIGAGEYPAAGSCPDMDYVCVHNNRIWGVKGNYIYASSSGYAMGAAGSDGRYGWTQFYDAVGNPDDSGSFFQEVASDGDFTGIMSWDDRIIALKERCHHEINGSYPSTFALSTISKLGTVSHHSMAEVNGRAFYASQSGVYVYAGGYEKEIGRKLNENIKKAVAGSDGNRYYLCLDNGAEKKLYVYHTAVEMWTEEDLTNILFFTYQNGRLYACCSDGKIWIMNDPASAEAVEWRFKFTDYADSVYYNTELKRLIFKWKSAKGNTIKVKISTDGKTFRTLTDFRFVGEEMQTVKCNVNRGREHVIVVEGKGDIDVYGYQLTVMKGGQNIV